MIKETRLTDEVYSLKKGLVLTTRASVGEYFDFFKRINPNFQTRNLGDHAASDKILSAIKSSDMDDIILGGKEAVKILTPTQYSDFLKTGKVNFLYLGKVYRLHRASLNLSIEPQMEDSIKLLIESVRYQ